MKRVIIKAAVWQPDAFLPWLALLSALFLIGAAVGCTSVAMVDDNSREELYSYIAGTMTSQNGRTFIALLASFFNLSKYHLIAYACGFTALGVLVLPVVMAIRGYFLAFSAAAFIKVFGLHGFTFSFLIFGVQSLISLPCLFILAIQSLQISIYLFGTAAHRQRGSYLSPVSRTSLSRLGFCLAALLICSLYDTFLVPFLILRMIG